LNELKKTFSIIRSEEYEKLIPRPSAEEYKSLRDSLDMEGQKDPIVVTSKGIILDGYTREEILENLGREIEYRIKDFKNINDEKYYVIETNLNRRQLNSFQKIELSRLLYEDIRAQLKERSNKYARSGNAHTPAPDNKHLKWRELLSARIGVGETQCQRAMALIKKNDFITLRNLREGMISIDQAYRDMTIGLVPIELVRKKSSLKEIVCPECKYHGSRRSFKKW